MTGGFAKIEKTMKFLKIPKLFLYPRFHATVKGDLDAVQMQVEEVYISMTPRMKMIQLGLLEMLESCLNELLKANPAVHALKDASPLARPARVQHGNGDHELL